MLSWVVIENCGQSGEESLVAKKPVNHRKPWTGDDVAKLKRMAPRRPVGIIANELKRTEDAIRNKAQEEGFSMAPAERPPYSRRP